MYYNYDEYMKEVLGYPPNNPEDRKVGFDDPFQASVTYRQEYQPRQQVDLTTCYPEIYKMLMPMVTKACENLYEPVTENDITRIALDIYFQFESDDRENDRKEETEENNRSIPKTESIRTESSPRNNVRRFDRNLEKSITSKPTQKEEPPKEENREEERVNTFSRRPRNRLLFDLIRILILNQILGRPNFPGRPPRPRPPRPRPPIRPRDEYMGYEDDFDYPYWQY